MLFCARRTQSLEAKEGRNFPSSTWTRPARACSSMSSPLEKPMETQRDY